METGGSGGARQYDRTPAPQLELARKHESGGGGGVKIGAESIHLLLVSNWRDGPIYPWPSAAVVAGDAALTALPI
jgi:hypothetical protein